MEILVTADEGVGSRSSRALVEERALACGAVLVLERPDLGTTVTLTVASAGSTENVVPAAASVTVDVRVGSTAEAERIGSAFAALAPHVEGAEITVRGALDRPPMPTSASAELFTLADRLLPHVARDPQPSRSSS